jgi:hypothetical protein
VNLRALERVPIRTRESGVTHSAWQMEVETDDGVGTITVVDSGAATFWRGGGAFLGWPAEQLEAAYNELLKTQEAEPATDFPQLG